MARVFISHASDDESVAGRVHGWLVDDGHEVFRAHSLRDGIPVGVDWEQRLHDELRRADAVVCVVTSAFLTSRWCTAEVAIARSRGCRLLPVRAEPGLIDPLLSSVQYVDMTREPDEVRPFLAGALRQLGAVWPGDRSPFPGLLPFEADQHQVFFGRAEEIGQLAGMLRSPVGQAAGAAVLVVGPSGCGKSSLVRAGLLPVLGREPEWLTLQVLVPGTDPVAALARELATVARRSGLGWTVAHVREQLAEAGLGRVAEELLLADTAGPRQRLLLVIDQLEELLTQTAAADRARLAALLRPALTGPVRMVATLRPEFLDQLLTYPELADLPTRVYPLRPLGRAALRTVIEKPARLAGITVHEDLVARLVDDTASGDALPLLAFTLAQLADGVTRGGQLSCARYDQLGGVQGALTRQADAALADAVAAGGRDGDQVIANLLRLVTVDEQGHPTRWRVRRDELPAPVTIELDPFVARRLLTTSTGDGPNNDVVVMGVAHEALLSAWPPLSRAITAAAAGLRARRGIERAAAEWHDHGRAAARLWGGGHLAAAVIDTGARLRPDTTRRWVPTRRRVLVTDRVDTSPRARDFLRASIRRDRHRRRRAVVVLSALLAMALVSAGIAVLQQARAREGQRVAQEQQRIATATGLVGQATAARTTNQRTALRLSLAAHRINPTGETRTNLINTLIDNRYAHTLDGPVDEVSVAFAPGEHTTIVAAAGRVFGGDTGEAVLWDVADPVRPHRLGSLAGHASGITALAFTADARMLATGGEDGAVVLWDVTDPTRPRRSGSMTGHDDTVTSVSFAPDGRTLATGSGDRTAILWDVTDPNQPRQLGAPLDHQDWVSAVAFAPDGRTLATGSEDGAVILWDLTTLSQPRPINAPLMHDGFVGDVTFSPDSHTLAVGSDYGAVLWDVTDLRSPRQLGPPLAGTRTVRSCAFSPDGRTLATAGDDATVMVWDLTDLDHPSQVGAPLAGHLGSVWSVAFAPDGHTVASGTTAGELNLWDLNAPTHPQPLGQPLTSPNDGIPSVAFSSDGHTLATGGNDGVLLWALTEPAQPRQLGGPLPGTAGAIPSLALTPDGNTLVVGGSGGVVLWDVTRPLQPRQLEPPLVGPDADGFSLVLDGHTLAVGVGAGVVLWDLTEPARPRRLGTLPNGHTAPLAFTAGGRVLAATDRSRAAEVSLWDLADAAHPRPLPTLDGDLVGSGRDTVATSDFDEFEEQTVTVWSLTDPAHPRRLGAPLRGHYRFVESVAFATDRHMVAVAADQGPITLWDATDPGQPGRLTAALPGNTDGVSLVAFAPNQRTLATDNADGQVLLWDLTEFNDLLTNPVTKACAITDGGFDDQEWTLRIPGIPYQNTCPDIRPR